MLDKIAWIVFFAGVAIWFAGIRNRIVEIAIVIAAIVLLILQFV